eukprot:400717_1
MNNDNDSVSVSVENILIYCTIIPLPIICIIASFCIYKRHRKYNEQNKKEPMDITHDINNIKKRQSENGINNLGLSDYDININKKLPESPPNSQPPSPSNPQSLQDMNENGEGHQSDSDLYRHIEQKKTPQRPRQTSHVTSYV